MARDPPALKRALFGYRRETVQQLLLGRDAMFSRARERLKETEEELARKKAELQQARFDLDRATQEAGSTDEENIRLRRELEKALTELRTREASEPAGSPAEVEAIRAELARQTDAAQEAERRAAALDAEARTLREHLQHRDESLQPPEPYPIQELAPVFDAAERTFRRLIEQARDRSARELQEVAKARQQLDEQVERFATWRDHVMALIGSVREAVANARAQTQHTPERLREALAPTTDAMVSVNDSLAEFMRATDQPSEGEPAGGDPPPVQPTHTASQQPNGPAASPDDGDVESLPRDFGLQ